MYSVTTNQASLELPKLIAETTRNHQPIRITSPGQNAVLLAQEDWDAIQETLFLLSIPGMRESILQGMETPVDECATELDW